MTNATTTQPLCCSYVPISNTNDYLKTGGKSYKEMIPVLECGKRKMLAARQKTEVQCLATVTL